MKTFRALALVLGLSLVTPSCQLFRAKDPSAVVVDAAPAIFNSLTIALVILDSVASQYVKDMPSLPTPDDLKAVRRLITNLDTAKSSLEEIKAMVDKDQVELSKLVAHTNVIISNLELAISDLELLGVKIPPSVKSSIEIAKGLTKWVPST